MNRSNILTRDELIEVVADARTTGKRIVLANGSMTSNSGGEGEIRKNIVKAGLVDCMVALPTQLFYNTQIPACLWFLARDRKNHKFRDRSKEILLIDARKLGYMVNRTNRAFDDKDIKKIATTYHSWRNRKGKYKNIKGFCKSAHIAEIEENEFVMTPGRYVGNEDLVEDTSSFEDTIRDLSVNLTEQFNVSRKLERRIKKNLSKLGIEL